MKALLDTHAFLWWINNSPSLSQTAREFIQSDEHEIFLSAATVWELAIKAGKGRIILPEALESIVSNALAYYHFSVLPIQFDHACRVMALPNHHNDPFDRILIAQCQCEDMVLLSADQIVPNYDVRIIW